MKVVVASRKNEKKSPMLSMMLINRFEGNCGTFGEEKIKFIVVNDNGLICPTFFIKNILNYIFIYIKKTIMG